MTQKDTLPDGWTRTTIGDSFKIVRGISFPKDAKVYAPKPGYIACLRTTNVQREVEWGDLWFVPAEHVKRDEQIIQPLDILISTANSLELVGKVAQVKSVLHPATLGAFISLIRVPVGTNPKFVYFQLASSRVQAAIRSKASTTTNISNISTSKLADVNLSIPSLSEQQRIVERIESLFTQLDTGVAGLKRVQTALKRYKASVLKAACEGRLVPSGRSVAAPVPGEGGLPEGWRWVTVKDIGDKDEQIVLTGPFGSNLGKEDFANTGVAVLTIGCLTEYGLILDKAKYISEAKAIDLQKYRVREGDLLFSRMATVGRAGLVAKQFENMIFNYHLMRLRLDPALIDAFYFMYYVRGSKNVTDYVKQVNHGATRDGINTEQLLNLPVLLPPLDEQQRIVEEIERRLSVVQELEQTVSASLQRAERLRQSILKRAFEGKLVQ